LMQTDAEIVVPARMLRQAQHEREQTPFILSLSKEVNGFVDSCIK